MKELSLNVLDITKNSVKANATLIDISLVEEGNKLTLTITDNGCGMKPEVAATVMNPFYTTRTTRKVGMGVPLLMLAAENAPMVEPLRLRDKMPLSHDASSVSGLLQEFRKCLLTAVKCAGIVLEAVDMAEFSGQYARS